MGRISDLHITDPSGVDSGAQSRTRGGRDFLQLSHRLRRADIAAAQKLVVDALPDDPLCDHAGEGVRHRVVIITPDPKLDVRFWRECVGLDPSSELPLRSAGIRVASSRVITARVGNPSAETATTSRRELASCGE